MAWRPELLTTMLVDVVVLAVPTATEPKVREVGPTLALARSGLGKSMVRTKEKQMNGHTHSVLRICGPTFVFAWLLNPERGKGVTFGAQSPVCRSECMGARYGNLLVTGPGFGQGGVLDLASKTVEGWDSRSFLRELFPPSELRVPRHPPNEAVRITRLPDL
jgi:hypothetical protein